MSEEEVKALVEMCQMLKAENAKLKQEKQELKQECLSQREFFHKKLGIAEEIAQKHKDRYYDLELKNKKLIKWLENEISYCDEKICFTEVYKEQAYTKILSKLKESDK